MTATIVNPNMRMTVADINAGDYPCFINENPMEYRKVVELFVKKGLENGEKILLILGSHTPEEVLGFFGDPRVEKAVESGAMEFETSDRIYLDGNGDFDPEKILSKLKGKVSKTLEEGYPILRIFTEMEWILGTSEGFSRFMSYGRKLEEFFRRGECMAICHYDRKKFPAELLLNALRVHRFVILADEAYYNFYHIPSKKLEKLDFFDVELSNWLKNLREHKKAMEDVRAMNTLKKTIEESLLSGVSITGLDGTITYVNRAFCEMVGWDEDELIGQKPPYLFWPPELAEITMKFYKKDIIDSRNASLREARFIRKNGERFNVVILTSPLVDDNGNVNGQAGSFYDLTDQRKLTDALNESEQRFRTLVQSMDDAIFTLDTDDRYTWLGGGWFRINGVDSSGYIGKTLREALMEMNPDIDKITEKNLRIQEEGHRRALNGETVAYEWKSVNGGDKYVHTTLSPMRNSNGDIVGVVGVSHDITERKIAEKELRMYRENLEKMIERRTGQLMKTNKNLKKEIRERKRVEKTLSRNEETYRMAIEQTGQIVYDYDMEEGKMKVYGAVEEITGMTPDEFRRIEFFRWKEFIHPDDVQRVGIKLERAFKRELRFSVEHRFRRKDGTYVPVESSGVFMKNQNGDVCRLLGTMKDITERKRVDEALRRSNRALMVLGDSQHVLMHVREEKKLLEDICGIIVKIGGYRMAYVGFIHGPKRKKIVPIAKAGREDDRVDVTEFFVNDAAVDPISRTVRTGTFSVSRNITNDPSCGNKLLDGKDCISLISLPLKEDRESFGVLNIYSSEENSFDSEEIRFLIQLADELSYGITALRNFIRKKRAEDAFREAEMKRKSYEEMVTKDALTGVYTRRFFNEWMEKYASSVEKGKFKCTLVMTDIDSFKKINDTYGHAVGDTVLVHVAKLMESSVRETDLVVRYGGDEFLIVFPDTDEEEVFQSFKRVEKLLEEESEKIGFKLSVSYGVAKTESLDSLPETLKFADMLMYEMKKIHK